MSRLRALGMVAIAMVLMSQFQNCARSGVTGQASDKSTDGSVGMIGSVGVASDANDPLKNSSAENASSMFPHQPNDFSAMQAGRVYHLESYTDGDAVTSFQKNDYLLRFLSKASTDASAKASANEAVSSGEVLGESVFMKEVAFSASSACGQALHGDGVIARYRDRAPLEGKVFLRVQVQESIPCDHTSDISMQAPAVDIDYANLLQKVSRFRLHANGRLSLMDDSQQHILTFAANIDGGSSSPGRDPQSLVGVLLSAKSFVSPSGCLVSPGFGSLASGTLCSAQMVSRAFESGITFRLNEDRSFAVGGCQSTAGKWEFLMVVPPLEGAVLLKAVASNAGSCAGKAKEEMDIFKGALNQNAIEIKSDGTVHLIDRHGYRLILEKK